MKRYGCWLIIAVLSLGCSSLTFWKKEESKLWFHEQVSSSNPTRFRRDVMIPVSNIMVSIDPRPVLTEKSIRMAEIIENAGGPAILVRFDPSGTMALDQATTRGRGKYLVVMLDDRPLVAWQIDRRLALGQFLIESNLDEEQTEKLVESLRRTAKKYHEGNPVLRAPL